MGVTERLGALVHGGLHLLEDLRHAHGEVFDGDHFLAAVIAAHHHGGAGLDVLRAQLHTHRDAAHLLLGEFPAGGLIGRVDLRPEHGGQRLAHFLGLLEHAFLVLRDRDDHHLRGRDVRRQDQAGIIAVHHDDGADDTGGQAPGGLVDVLELVILIGELDAEGPGKAVAEIVAGAGLQRLAVMHHGLDGVGGLGAGKLLLIGLAALDQRDGQILFHEIRVDVEHLNGPLLSLLRSGVGRVAFLPQEFGVA